MGIGCVAVERVRVAAAADAREVGVSGRGQQVGNFPDGGSRSKARIIMTEITDRARDVQQSAIVDAST
jgi:hypothetical protein